MLASDRTEELPTYPAVPDETGRDILLAGILAEEEFMWRGCRNYTLCFNLGRAG